MSCNGSSQSSQLGGNSLLLEPCSDQQKGSEGISVKIDTLMFEYKTVSGKYIYIPITSNYKYIHEQKASWTSMQLQGFLRIHIRSWDSGIGIRGEVIKSICQVSTGKRSSVITFPFSGHWPLKCNSNKKYRWNHLHSSSTSSKSPTTEKIARSTTFPRYLNMFCWIRFSYVSNIRHQ